MKTNVKLIILVFLLLLIPYFSPATELIAAKVITVIDGNTIEVMGADKDTFRIMLHGIDCPELGQEYGDKARLYLEKLLLDKAITIEMKGKDRWGTRLGVIIIDGKIDPRFELLKEGLAWTAERDADPEFEVLKERAKEKGKGLWKQENPVAPWKFRRQQTMLQLKSS